MGLLIIIVVLLMMAAIFSLVGALVVMLCARVFAKVKVTYGVAYNATFSGYATFALLRVIAGFLVCELSMIFTLPALFVVHAFTYFRKVRGRDDKVLSVAQSCIVAAVQVAVVGVLFLWLAGPQFRPIDLPEPVPGRG